MPAAEFIPSFRTLFSPMMYRDYPDPGCGCEQSYQESIIRSHEANLAGSLVLRLSAIIQESDDMK